MKNIDDYFSENPGRPVINDESSRYLSGDANYIPQRNEPEENMLRETDKNNAVDYAVEDDDHYAG